MPFGSRREVVVAQEVAPAQVHGSVPDLAGGDVEQDLTGQRLELPRPPVRRRPAVLV